jgi:hypothetical protein
MKRSELKSYPPPPCMATELSKQLGTNIEGNPACICPNPMVAFFCQTGHMLECHYPLNCEDAMCSHLAKYDMDFEEDAQ